MASGGMHNADMYYATHFLAVDPFVYLRVPHEGKDILVVSQMEYERARITSEERQVEAKINLPFNRRCKRPQR
jgi:Xaa-Pro aminopeptidase